MATRTPATHTPGMLLVLAAALLVIGAIARAIWPRRASPENPNADQPDTSFVLPPNLARDPFLSATPKPAPLIASRPSVRGEVAFAVVAIGAYVAVAAVSFLGGDGTPDLLSVRGDSATAEVHTAAVLSAQATPAASTETLIETSTPAPIVSLPAPTEVPAFGEPTAGPEPERPAQHTLRTGETLTSVAALYGITVYDLATANRLSTDRVLAGQVLQIPAP